MTVSVVHVGTRRTCLKLMCTTMVSKMNDGYIQSLYSHLSLRSAFPSSFEIRRDKTRLEVTSRIAETVTRLLMSGLVTRENPGKFPDFSPLKTNNTVPTQNKDYDGTGSG